MIIRAVVVDDELLARQRITDLLAEESDVSVVAECTNGTEAVQVIVKLKPDLLFLDVQMPELNGFEVLQHLNHLNILPKIIFVTAYDQYALQAFDVNALDYLLKPFDKMRFRQTIQRVRDQLGLQQDHIPQEYLMEFVKYIEKTNFPQRLAIRSRERVYFLTTENISWIEASGNYVKLHEGAESHLLRKTMKEIRATLDPQKFLQIHRSLIVNIANIRELRPWSRGVYEILLKDGTQLHSSRSFQTQIDLFILNNM